MEATPTDTAVAIRTEWETPVTAYVVTQLVALLDRGRGSHGAEDQGEPN